METTDPTLEDPLAPDRRWLRSLARSLVSDPSAADDLVQETWLVARQNRPISSSRSFLAGILRNLVRRSFRADRRRKERERRVASREPLPSAAELVHRAETQRALGEAMLALDEPFRTAMLLHHMEGLSPLEIAERQGVPVDTVRNRLRKGLEKIRHHLVQKHGRDWPSWRACLLPFASLPTQRDRFSNLALASFGVVLILAAWTLYRSADWTPSTHPGDSRGELDGGPTSSSATLSPDTSHTPTRNDIPAPETPKNESRDSRILRGVVSFGLSPLAKATVYLVEVGDPLSPFTAEILAKTQTTASGLFELGLPESNRAIDLGVVKNGYQRRLIEDVQTQRSERLLEISMFRGERLRGTVVDPQGRPIPYLPLWACEVSGTLQHLSLSENLRGAESLRLANRHSTYHDSFSRTDRQGRFDLSGLAPGSYALKSADARWQFIPETPRRTGSDEISQRAMQSLGAELVLFDRETLQRVSDARVTVEFGIRAGEQRGRSGELRARSHEGRVALAMFPETYEHILNGDVHGEASWTGTVSAAGYLDQEFDLRAPFSPRHGFIRERLHLIPSKSPLDDSCFVQFDVVYDDGLPCDRDLELTLLRSDGQRRTLFLSSQEEGDYSCRLPPGFWRVRTRTRCSLEPVASVIEVREDSMDLHEGEERSVRIELKRGGEVLVIPPPEWLSVRQWQVVLTSQALGLSWPRLCSEPRLLLSGIPPGEWTVSVASPGAPPGDSVSSPPLVLRPGDPIEVRFD